MNKGKVIKVEKHYSTLITTSGEFVNIKNKGKMFVGQNVIFTEYDIYNNKSKIIAFKTVAAVFALVLLLNAYMKIVGDNLAFAVVSLDINPSIELQIDDEFKVIEIEALNEDGNEIVDKSFVGMEMSYVVKSLVENAKQKKYLNDNGDILIATAILTQEKFSADEITDIIYEKVFKEDGKVNVYMVNSTKEDYEQANKEDISLGKYKVIQTSNADINIERVKNQSVRQLKENNILNKKEIVNKREEIEKIKQDIEQDKKDKEDKEDKSKEHKDKIEDKYKEKIKDNEHKEVGKIDPKEKNKQDNKLSEKIKEVSNINNKLEKDDKEQDYKENQKIKDDIKENEKEQGNNNKIKESDNLQTKDDKEQDYKENQKLKDDIKEVEEDKKEITNHKTQKDNKKEKDNKNNNSKKY